MSPRAAWRLETLGFGEVYDYTGSKMDWIGEDLPFEGTLAGMARLSTLADPRVPTCSLGETVGQVRPRMTGWDLALVMSDEESVVLGLLRAAPAGGDDSRPVTEAMEEGPSTYRPHVTAREMSQRLEKSPASEVIVTTLSGRLLGMARPDDIHAAASRPGG